MCARFEITDSVRERLRAAAEKADETVFTIHTGEVRPGDSAPLLFGEGGLRAAAPMTWGLPRWDGKGLLINTRAETAADKPLFRDSLHERRAIIPAHVFYEWDRRKNKVAFALPGREVMFLAGIFDAQRRFSVLTTAANDSMAPYHERMPVLLREDALWDWLFDEKTAALLLREKQPALEARPEQLTLF